MPILVFAEQRNGILRKCAGESLTQGRLLADQTGDKLFVSLIGKDISNLPDEVNKYGADQILISDDNAFSLYNTETYAARFADIIKAINANLVLMAHTAMGKDLAPRVAEKMGAGLASDCINIELKENELYFFRPMYAGKIIAKIKITTPIKMATLRANNFPVIEKTGQLLINSFTADIPIPRARVEKVNLKESGRPELTEAEIVVAGGRGLGGKEGFDVIEQLADIFGAAVGASRAAVDANWREHQDQIGLTGKVVTPKLYIACGVSGAIQHTAGMGSSKYIVAVNKDLEANIMKIANLAVAGDLNEIIPEFIKQLSELKSKEQQ